MLEVDRDLAHKVFDLLEAGKTPYAIAKTETTSVRTARRLKAASEGFETGASDNDISRATGWRAKRVALIRRWWVERPRVTGPGGADIELGPHARELFYFFGQRFKDLLSVPPPHEVVAMTRGEYKGAMWKGWPSGGLATPPRDVEEEAVAREWGSGRRDARTHALFPAFRQHALDHERWESLDHVESEYNDYGQACRQGYEAILGEVRRRLLNVSEERAEVFAKSLLLDGFYRKRGGTGINFSYDLHEVRQGDLSRWELKLGAWFILASDPAEPRHLADVHQQLRASPPYDAELNALAEAERRVSEAAASFQASLSPDALLRKLVLNGHCEWCP